MLRPVEAVQFHGLRASQSVDAAQQPEERSDGGERPTSNSHHSYSNIHLRLSIANAAFAYVARQSVPYAISTAFDLHYDLGHFKSRDQESTAVALAWS